MTAPDGVPLARCNRCEHLVFPYRQVCSCCGASDWRMERVGEGRVECVTRRTPRNKRRPLPTGNWVEQGVVHIASVIVKEGVEVTAKCDESVSPGDAVALRFDAHGTVNREGHMVVAGALHGAGQWPTT